MNATTGMGQLVDPYVGGYSDRYVNVNGLRLHYTEWNAQNPSVVVMLHGLNVQAHTWDPVASDLAVNHRVISLDLRGHGDSDWSRAGYHLEDFVADLAAVATSLGLGRFHLVTHSLGARIGIAFAGKHHHAVRSLYLSDTGPEMPRSTAASVSSFIATTNAASGFRNRDEVRAYYAEVHPEWLPELLDLHALHQVRLNWAGKYVLKADPELYWITRGIGVREIDTLWDRAGRIVAPTYIMRGVRSDFFDDELLERMQAAIKGSQVVTFDTGHYIPREDPKAFSSAILETADAHE